MRITHIDIHLAGDAYLVTPAGEALPHELALALGGLRYGWSQELGAAALLPGWRAVRSDIEACGYGIVSAQAFAALLVPPPAAVREASGRYPMAA